eukprot:9080853-Pyramimonas_sp.AAC.1
MALPSHSSRGWQAASTQLHSLRLLSLDSINAPRLTALAQLSRTDLSIVSMTDRWVRARSPADPAGAPATRIFAPNLLPLKKSHSIAV